ncbi:hypothetical protein PV325_001216 [Microctonus aethiopoides]|nr:hypothetical protein PV325_001216 [Microctonus aethiopoides]
MLDDGDENERRIVLITNVPEESACLAINKLKQKIENRLVYMKNEVKDKPSQEEEEEEEEEEGFGADKK